MGKCRGVLAFQQQNSYAFPDTRLFAPILMSPPVQRCSYAHDKLHPLPPFFLSLFFFVPPFFPSLLSLQPFLVLFFISLLFANKYPRFDFQLFLPLHCNLFPCNPRHQSHTILLRPTRCGHCRCGHSIRRNDGLLHLCFPISFSLSLFPLLFYVVLTHTYTHSK